MKEFKTPEGVMVTGGGQGYVLPKAQMVQVQQGQHLMIAAMAGTTAQVLADMNDFQPIDLSREPCFRFKSIAACRRFHDQRS